MDFKRAIGILELNHIFSLSDLKKNYYRLSLKWHPDKNKTKEATEKFQSIKEAYDYLKTYLNVKAEIENENEADNEYVNVEGNVDFFHMFHSFVSTISGNVINKQTLSNIIKNVTDNCGKISVKIFEGLDKETSLRLYDYFHQYSDILHITDDTLDQIKEIIKEKFKNDHIIILHPKLNNLLNDDLYKLEFEGNTYCIPLWHDELIYDLSCSQLRVKILPQLEDHITIDNNNNIIVNLSTKIKGLLTLERIVFKIGDKPFEIPCEELKIKKNQRHIFKRKGIAIINQQDVYNITERSNIIIHLTLLDE